MEKYFDSAPILDLKISEKTIFVSKALQM